MEKSVIKIPGISQDITPIGFGTWQIGDRLFWNYGKTYQYTDSQEAFRLNIANGINFIDTAEVYGFGKSESLLGGLLREADRKLVVATKFFPYPWRLSKKSVTSAIKNSLYRLKLDRVDLYQLHWPFLSFRMRSWADGLTEIIQSGLSKAVGVSNFNSMQTEKMFSLLNERGIQLATNQVEYNLLNREIEKNDLLKICNDYGITIIAYSPIAQGLLTGKYTQQNPLKGVRGFRYRSINMSKLEVLIDEMREIGRKYNSCTPSQVAINWLMCKGVLPIPGAKTKNQAIENIGAVGWRLNEQDIEKLDEVSNWLTQQS